MNIGSVELLIILMVILLVFGSKQLPLFAKKFGKGFQEFQKATRDVKDEFQKIIEDDDNGLQG